jgi:predicted membrane protein
VNAGRATLGAVLVAVGALLLIDAAGGADAGRIITTWWPLVFVFLGVVQVVLERRVPAVAALLVGGGTVALLVTTGVVDADLWALLWPVLLIGAGVWLVARRHLRPVSRDDEVIRLAVFAPARLTSKAARLRRIDATAVFTSLRVDLSGATLDPAGARVAATSVFGNVVVVVPHGWDVDVRGVPVLGGWDDTVSRTGIPPGAPRLRVGVLTLFGGVEVRHPDRWRPPAGPPS